MAKRAVVFADEIMDESPEQLKCWQQQPVAKTNSRLTTAQTTFDPGKRGAGDISSESKAASAVGDIIGHRRIGAKRRLSVVEPLEKSLEEQEETCCFFGTKALTKALDAIASYVVKKQPEEPEMFSSTHFTEANVDLTEYQKGTSTCKPARPKVFFRALSFRHSKGTGYGFRVIWKCLR